MEPAKKDGASQNPSDVDFMSKIRRMLDPAECKLKKFLRFLFWGFNPNNSPCLTA